VLEVGADLLVGALGVAGDALDVLLDLRVVIDLEVIGRVGVPFEVVVVDAVLVEIGHERRLRARRDHARRQDDERKEDQASPLHDSTSIEPMLL